MPTTRECQKLWGFNPCGVSQESINDNTVLLIELDGGNDGIGMVLSQADLGFAQI
jgi:hypothetical protein